MAFQKGVSGNPGGRPKGAKTKFYLSLKFWFEMVAENAEDLEPQEKIEIAFRAINILAPKVPNLPADPNDSVDNARRAQDLLNALEGGEPRPSGPVDTPTPAPEGMNGSDPHP